MKGKNRAEPQKKKKMCFMSTARSWLYWNLNTAQVLTFSQAISNLQLLQYFHVHQSN